MNYCYVFIGPSGSGKTSLAEAVFQPEQKIITYTNRSPRPGEKDQVDYYFVSDDTFNQMIKRDEFAEWDQYAQHKYGSSKAEITKKTEGRKLLCRFDGKWFLAFIRVFWHGSPSDLYYDF